METYILKNLNDAGIVGRTFKFIQNFLRLRSFKFRNNGALTYTNSQTGGVSHAL